MTLIPIIEAASGGLLEDILSIRTSTVLGAFLIALIIAFMAAAVPAHQALRLKVVDALRQG
jgi:ABC-type antimicrobial peptide transport system permease subunit